MQANQNIAADAQTLTVCWIDNVTVATGIARVISEKPDEVIVDELGGAVRLGRDVHPIAMRNELALMAGSAWRM